MVKSVIHYTWRGLKVRFKILQGDKSLSNFHLQIQTLLILMVTVCNFFVRIWVLKHPFAMEVGPYQL